MTMRNRRYVHLAILIFVQSILIYALRLLGIRATAWITNDLGTAVFFVPIVALLFYASSDEHFNKRARSFSKICGWFTCGCWLAGAIATLAFE